MPEDVFDTTIELTTTPSGQVARQLAVTPDCVSVSVGVLNQGVGQGSLITLNRATGAVLETRYTGSNMVTASKGDIVYYIPRSGGNVKRFRTTGGTITDLSDFSNGYYSAEAYLTESGFAASSAFSENWLYYRLAVGGFGRIDVSQTSPSYIYDTTISCRSIHSGGSSDTVYVAGQDGKVRIITASNGAVRRTINLSTASEEPLSVVPTDTGKLYIFTNLYQSVTLKIYRESDGSLISTSNLNLNPSYFKYATRVGNKVYFGQHHPDYNNFVYILDTKTDSALRIKYDWTETNGIVFYGSRGYLIDNRQPQGGTIPRLRAFDNGIYNNTSSFLTMF